MDISLLQGHRPRLPLLPLRHPPYIPRPCCNKKHMLSVEFSTSLNMFSVYFFQITIIPFCSIETIQSHILATSILVSFLIPTRNILPNCDTLPISPAHYATHKYSLELYPTNSFNHTLLSKQTYIVFHTASGDILPTCDTLPIFHDNYETHNHIHILQGFILLLIRQ